MYDEKYYQDKQIKVTNRLVKKMDEALATIANTLNVYFSDKDELVKELGEINGIIKNKGELPKSKEEIAKAAVEAAEAQKVTPPEVPKVEEAK